MHTSSFPSEISAIGAILGKPPTLFEFDTKNKKVSSSNTLPSCSYLSGILFTTLAGKSLAPSR